MPTHLRHFALQAAAALLVFTLAWPFYYLRAAAWDWALVAMAVGATAFAIARLSRQSWWWQLIHLVFAPLLWAGMQIDISPLWHLAVFMLLFLTFRGAASGQIPLYLSRSEDASHLNPVLPRGCKLLDVGAGLGSLLLPLRRLRPDLKLFGIENAPLPWVLGWARTRGKSIDWYWGNLWEHSLVPYQALYCFLSPVPMEALWTKACAEMAPGSLFVSKTFPIPGVTCETTIAIGPEEQHAFYIYRIPCLD